MSAAIRKRRCAAPIASSPIPGCRWATRPAKANRHNLLKPYQVNARLMAKAKPERHFHALPAGASRRGSHRRGDGRPAIGGVRRGREPLACAEGHSYLVPERERAVAAAPISAHSRESGNPAFWLWVPAFAGTSGSNDSGSSSNDRAPMTIEIPTRTPSPHTADDTILPFEVAALDLRGRVVRLGPAVDDILVAPRLSGAGLQAARRGDRARRLVRLVAEIRRPLHPADAGRRAGAHAGGRLRDRRPHARLRALRQGPRRRGDRSRQGIGRRIARPRPSGHDHRSGRRHEPLSGSGRARRRRARRCGA